MRKAVRIAGLLAMLAAPAYGQSVTGRIMGSSNVAEGTAFRTSGFYGSERYKFFGELSAYDGADKDYFGILSAHRELPRGFELVGEFDKGRGSPPGTGVGLGYDVRFRNGGIGLHLIPVKFNGGSFARETEVSAFGGRQMGRYYLQGRGSVTFPYSGDSRFNGEICIGRDIGDGMAAEMQIAKNGHGNAVRGGMVYKIK